MLSVNNIILCLGYKKKPCIGRTGYMRLISWTYPHGSETLPIVSKFFIFFSHTENVRVCVPVCIPVRIPVRELVCVSVGVLVLAPVRVPVTVCVLVIVTVAKTQSMSNI